MADGGSLRARIWYGLGAVALLLVYALAATALWTTRDFADEGPLSFDQPALTAPLPGAVGLEVVEARCRADYGTVVDPSIRLRLVGGQVEGVNAYACYLVGDGGSVLKTVVLTAAGEPAPEALERRSGAWPWIGVVKTPSELLLAGVGIVVITALAFLYYRRPRPGPPPQPTWWQRSGANAVAGLTCVLPLTLPFRGGESPGRRLRLLFLWIFGWSAAVLVALFLSAWGDALSMGVLGFLLVAMAYGWVMGRFTLAPPGFGAPDGVAAPAPDPRRAIPAPAAPAPRSMAAVVTGGPPPAVAPAPDGPAFEVLTADQLPTFADLGGMEPLKAELSDTFGLLLAFADEADAYRITFNGIVLHGPPGVGKTMIAKATAGEFGMNFLHVSTGDLLSKYVGESSKNIQAVFETAARNVPCLLFFDEFDSVAARRDDEPDQESRRIVNQLLQSVERWRPVADLVVMAATNGLDKLDPAVIRAGRFDRHVRIDLPDAAARAAILDAQLAGRPSAGLDTAALAAMTEGLTPATLTAVVEAAALAAFRRSTATGATSPITQDDLVASLRGRGGKDRPTVERWSWDRLVLAEETKAELQQIQALLADPDLARRYGIDPPSGLLLAGPPGTGKTTVARVLAAEARCSFYAASVSDLTSKWVGESEDLVTRLFERARENVPSIIFLDEIDALAPDRDQGWGVDSGLLTQLLTEIDGMSSRPGVFVIGATNRPDALDPAITRGGRLSRTVWIPLPDRAARRRLLGMFADHMPLADDVDLDALAAKTDGLPGADLEALCQQAGLRALMRHGPTTSTEAGSGTAATAPTAAAPAAPAAPATTAPATTAPATTAPATTAPATTAPATTAPGTTAPATTAPGTTPAPSATAGSPPAADTTSPAPSAPRTVSAADFAAALADLDRKTAGQPGTRPTARPSDPDGGYV